MSSRSSARIHHTSPIAAAAGAVVEPLEPRRLLTAMPLAETQGGTPDYYNVPNWTYSPAPIVDPVTGEITGGLRKFVDSLPGLTDEGINNLGQYISVAVPDRVSYPGADYYEIALVQYRVQMHSDLNPTTLRGYVQIETAQNFSVSKHFPLTYPDGTAIRNSAGQRVFAVDPPQYLGATIVAEKDRATRIKFTNYLPTGEGGDLFLPVDTTVMGAGMGPNMSMVMMAHRMDNMLHVETMGPHGLQAGTKIMLHGFAPEAYNGEYRVQSVTDANHFSVMLSEDPGGPVTTVGSVMEMYTDNRGTLHLHGGLTPWISDGTQHQWTTPAGEFTNYDKGASVVNVPDMPDPGDGSITFFYPNQQSARLMFYHDHAFGITRLNVYAGEAAGYLLTDPVEQDIVNRGILPSEQIPLILQDKTFIDPYAILNNDPTWPFQLDDELSDLWMPHVYMPNQNPNLLDGVAPYGRWDYGPWIWPPFPSDHPPIELPDGTLGFGYDEMPDLVPNLPDLSMGMESFFDTPLVNGTAYPFMEVDPKAYRFRILNASNDRFWNLQLIQADTEGYKVGGLWPTEVPMVNFDNLSDWPAGWPTPDMREGGIPDPSRRGPQMIQIGTESGFLPNPVVWDNIPIGWDRDGKSMTVNNILEHNLFLGPAERADVIIDFSQFAGMTLILYNDGPAAVPASDARYDFYSGNPDQTDGGGTVSTLPGYGPNTRTVMQIRVRGTPAATPFSLAALNAEFATTTDPATGEVHPGVFARGQDPILVPQAAYNAAYGVTDFPSGLTAYERIQSTSLTFRPLDLSTPALGDRVSTPVTITNSNKAIIEEFNTDWGRMSGYLGVEVPFTNALNQTSLWFRIQDPVTEIFENTANPLMTPIGSLEDGTQLWKITHNGVDTHPIHFHMFDVQVINRVDWAGVVKPPEPNELGWKDTVRMNPLEDIIIAMRPTAPVVPFGVPDSVRLLDPTMPQGTTMGFQEFDANGEPVTVTNEMYNFGWEYVWHCHILSHEEMDMMRPMQLNVDRALPSQSLLSGTTNGSNVDLFWTDPTPAASSLGDPSGEVGYRIERAQLVDGLPGAWSVVGTALANATTFTDGTADLRLAYAYRVVAYNAAGETVSNAANIGLYAPSDLAASLAFGPVVNLAFTDNSNDETGFVLERSSDGGNSYSVIASLPANTDAAPIAYIDITAAAGQSHVYRVKAIRGADSSVYATSSVVAVPATPAQPTNLKASIQTVNALPEVRLTFNDNSTNETQFIVERSINGGAYVAIGSVTANPGTGSVSYTDASLGLSGSTRVCIYRVRAVNDVTPSAYSSTASARIYPAKPATPTSLAAELLIAVGSQPQARLTFYDNATNETAFVVERSTNGGAFVSVGTIAAYAGKGTVTYTDATLGSSTSVRIILYRVRAVNDLFASDPSNSASVRILPGPSLPTSFTASVVGTQVDLNWAAGSANTTQYVLEYSTSATFDSVTRYTLTGTHLALADQPAGTILYFRIKAQNVYGESDWLLLASPVVLA